jgi:hypothetical protein
MMLSRIAVAVVVLALGWTAAALAQQKEPPKEEASAAQTEPVDMTPIDPDALPVNIKRIQKALSRPAAIRPDSVRPVFRVTIFSRNPTIDDILGPNWRQGPTPLGAMTHQEFLDLVTPNDVKGYAMFDNKQAAMFDNKQAAVVAATSFALKLAVTKAMEKLDEAMTERQKAAARKEVAEALAALKKARQEAGLPDK